VISTVISLIITPKYESSVVLFPAATTSVSRTLLSQNNPSKTGILDFGEEEEAERLLQVLNSDQIKSKIINKYNLVEHYEIDTAGKYVRTQLYNEYESNISFKRTEFLSVVISVRDKDPVIAANIANDIASLLDSTLKNIRRVRALKALKLVENEYFDLKSHIESLKDSLNYVMRLGVNDYESQSEVLNAAYAEAIIRGNEKAAYIISRKLDILSKYGDNYLALSNLLEFESERLSQMEEKYTEVEVEASQDLPEFYIVDWAYPSEKKAYPRRTIIVIVSSIITFIMALILLLLLDAIKKYRQSL